MRPRANKYRAVRTAGPHGHKYDSKAEARYASTLRLRVAAGEVDWFLEQVPFRLPGGEKYVADFIEFHSDGGMHVVDVKGVETPAFRAKKALVEATYPVLIEVVK